jgi:hypothetical protein
LSAAIAAGGLLQPLVDRLQAIEAALVKCRASATKAQFTRREARDFESRKDLADRLPEAVHKLSDTSFEFAELLRRIIPEFVILPIQALDTPLVRPRGKLTFCFDRLAAVVTEGANDGSAPQLCVTLDFFEPPVHIRAIAACRQARLDNPISSQRKIAASLGLNAMTVKRAFDYLGRIESAGLSDPYRELDAPPERASRWRRAEQPRRLRLRSSLPAVSAD